MNYDRLEEKRVELGMPRKELCMRADIARSTYDRYLKGQRRPNVEILARICKVLGMTLNDLM